MAHGKAKIVGKLSFVQWRTGLCARAAPGTGAPPSWSIIWGPLGSPSIFWGPPLLRYMVHGIFNGLAVGRGPQHVALSSDWAWSNATPGPTFGTVIISTVVLFQAHWDGPLGEVGGHLRLRDKRSGLVREFFVLADDDSPPNRMSVELQKWCHHYGGL